MEFVDVTRVAELTNWQEVNEYLDLGWKLIKVYTTAFDIEGPGANHQTPHFVMACIGASPEYPVKPEPQKIPGITIL